jgi:hypothetical protein
MARTAHHMSYARARNGRPWRTFVVHDLRYSAACLAVEGKRPQPELVRRVVEIYRFPRAFNDDPMVSWMARIAERKARRRCRRELRWGDATPARHRHGAVYDAW